MSQKHRITLYYDTGSPFSYIAFEILQQLQHTWGVALTLEPISVGALFKLTQNNFQATYSVKHHYLERDLQRKATLHNIKMHVMPDCFPTNTLLAQRLLIVVKQQTPQHLAEASAAIWKALWEHNQDISKPEVLIDALTALFTKEKVVQWLQNDVQQPAIKQALQAATKEALEAGAYGVPAIVVQRSALPGQPQEKPEFFFGSDRFDHVAAYLGFSYINPTADPFVHSRLSNGASNFMTEPPKQPQTASRDVNTESIWQNTMQPQTQASWTTVVKSWFYNLPITTRTVFTVCTSIYVVCLLIGYNGADLGHVCLSAQTAVKEFQVYRYLTSPFFHSGILHITFNMLAFLPDGAHLERQLGTVQFAYILVLLAVAADVMYTAISFVAAYTFWGTSILYSCAVGFSGIIFAVITIETHMSNATTRSIFGFFTVPAKAYPWALLFLWQLLMWNSVSFLGHLCGLLAGELYARGFFDWAKCSANTYRRMDQLWPFTMCYESDGYIAASSSLPTSYPAAAGSSSRLSMPAASMPSFSWLANAWPARATWPAAGAPGPSGVPHSTSQPLLQPQDRTQPQFPGNPRTLASSTEKASADDEQRPVTPAMLAAAAEARLGTAGRKDGQK